MPHLSERSCGAAGFTVLLERLALIKEKRRPFLDPDTLCFWTPRTPELKLLRARSVFGSVTSESLVLSVLFWRLKVSN